jgi:hypothetical protein
MNSNTDYLNSFHKITAGFLLTAGAAAAGVWTFLIVSGAFSFPDPAPDPAPGQSQELLAAVLHLGSESFLSAVSILTGVYLLFRSEKARRGLYFTLGILLSSTLNGIVFYTFLSTDPDLLMTVILGVIMLFAGGLFITGILKDHLSGVENQVLFKSGLILLGYIFYLLINTAARFASQDSWHFFIQIVAFGLVIPLYASALISQNNDPPRKPAE